MITFYGHPFETFSLMINYTLLSQKQAFVHCSFSSTQWPVSGTNEPRKLKAIIGFKEPNKKAD